MEDLKDEIKKLEYKIAEVRKRFPFHSVQPYLIQELEDLEEQLEKLINDKILYEKNWYYKFNITLIADFLQFRYDIYNENKQNSRGIYGNT